MMQSRARQSTWAGAAQSTQVTPAEFVENIELGVATAIGWLLVAVIIAGVTRRQLRLFP